MCDTCSNYRVSVFSREFNHEDFRNRFERFRIKFKNGKLTSRALFSFRGNSYWAYGAYFRKIKRPGIGRFVKSTLFEKKAFLIRIRFGILRWKVSKTTSSLRGFDLNLSFRIIQVPFWSDEPFSEKSLMQFFILNFHICCLKYFYHIFHTKCGMYYNIWKLNVKTNRNQTSTFSRFPWIAWVQFSRNIYLR